MELDLRWPIFLLANLLLVALLRMVNDAASMYGIYFCLPALLVLVPALHLPPRWGLLLCLITALFYMAPYPGPATPILIVFGVGYVIFRHYSSQLRRFRGAQLLTALVLGNCLLLLLQASLLSERIPEGSDYWHRVLTDSLLSALILYPVGSWFINLQYGAMHLLGSDPRGDAPPS